MTIDREYLIEKIKIMTQDYQSLAFDIQQKTDYLKKITGAIEMLESLLKEIEKNN